MVRVIQSYALISVGVKIIVTNTTTNSSGSSSGTAGPTAANSKQTIFTTQSGGKLADNVSILFGAKFAASLVPIELTVNLSKRMVCNDTSSTSGGDGDAEGNAEIPDAVTAVDFADFAVHSSTKKDSADSSTNADAALTAMSPASEPSQAPAATLASDTESRISPTTAAVAAECTVRGLVSKVGLGVGRSDNDRQFTFCNGRPVDLPRFAKVLNEVWRRYEMKQKPAFVLDIVVPVGYFDVNLTPDKREVLIVQEAVILDKLREVVDALYAPVRQTMPLNQGLAGYSQPNWASMFSSRASPSEDLTPEVPVNRKVQSALADYLVPISSQVTADIDMPQRFSTPLTPSHTSTGISQGVSMQSSPPLGQSSSATGSAPGSAHSGAGDASVLAKRAPVTWLSDMDKERLVLSSPPQKKARSDDNLSAFATSLSPSPSPSQSMVVDTPASASTEAVLERVQTQPAPPREMAWSADPAAALLLYKQRRALTQHRSAVAAQMSMDPTQQVREIGKGDTDHGDAFDISANAVVTDSNGDGDRTQARILNKKVNAHNHCILK